VLGYNPTKETPTVDTEAGGVFAQALKKVKQQKIDAALESATKLIESAVVCQAKWEDVERKFNDEKKKFHKELGKIVGKIGALARGESLASIEAKAAEEKDNDKKEGDE
jgi:hypothetical protein